MKIKPYLIIISTLFFIGCSKSEKTEKTNVEVNIRGEWVGGRKYINDDFGFVTEIPEGWYFKKGTDDDFMYETAAEFLVGEDEYFKAVLKSAMEKTCTLFSAYLYLLGTPGKTNPNVSMLVENLGHLPVIKSAKDYLLEDSFKVTNKNISFATEASKVEMGGVDFWMREIKVPMGMREMRQKYHGKIKGKYISVLVVAVVTEENENTVSELG
ncbi:MAG: hypothetical protein QNL01_03790 [Akkermansiaceae bacterium]|jgi:hypothetical protein|tara:strand:- start:2294 stop:2929 length:636 start_codon:yes stop_codon:yes gene_type:complete